MRTRVTITIDSGNRERVKVPRCATYATFLCSPIPQPQDPVHIPRSYMQACSDDMCMLREGTCTITPIFGTYAADSTIRIPLAGCRAVLTEQRRISACILLNVWLRQSSRAPHYMLQINFHLNRLVCTYTISGPPAYLWYMSRSVASMHSQPY